MAAAPSHETLERERERVMGEVEGGETVVKAVPIVTGTR
jgi:hypothetical protein